MVRTLFYERRKPNVLKFIDGSNKKVGRQVLGNRLGYIFQDIKVPFDLSESNCTIRLRLKKELGFIKAD